MAKAKQRTSRRLDARRGFTYLELGVVILVLSLFAAVAVPRITAMLESQESHAFRSRLVLMLGEAREQAITRGESVEVAFDGASFQVGENENLPMPEFVSIAQGMLDGVDLGSEDWSARFYPDGTSTSLSLEFLEAGEPWHITVNPTTAIGDWGWGSVPETGQTRWEAGELETRL